MVVTIGPVTAQPQSPPQPVAAAGQTAAGGVGARSRAVDHSAPIARTAAALLSVQGITWISSLANILIVPRFLGAADFGIFALATTVAMTVTLGASFGADNYIVKAVARQPGDAAATVAHIVAVRECLWLVSLMVLLPTAYLLLDNPRNRIVFTIVLANAALALASGAAMSALQGNHTMGKAALVGSLIGLVGQGIVVTVLFLGGGLMGVVVTGTAVAATGSIAAIYLFWRALGRRIEWSLPLARTLVIASLPFLAWDAALFIYGSIDYLLLGVLSDSKTVGEYAFAYKLATIPVFFTTIVGAALFPSFSTSIHANVDWTRRALTNSIRIITVVTLPMAVGVALLASDMSRVVGGGEFSQSKVLIPVVVMVVPLAAIDTILGAALFARDKQGAWARVAWLAAALNISCNLVLIPVCGHLFGRPALGAAIVTLVTECFMATFAWTMMRDYLDFPRVLRALGCCAIACAGMSVVVLLSKPGMGLIPAVVLGAVSFVAFAAALRVVQFDDVRWLRNALVKRTEGERVAI